MGFLERESRNVVNWIDEKFSLKKAIGVVVSAESEEESDFLDVWIVPYRAGTFGALKNVRLPKVCPDLGVTLKVNSGMIVSSSLLGVRFPSQDELRLAGVDTNEIIDAFAANFDSLIASKN